MPYRENPKQATAIFLSIKRRQGLAAAQAFGRKHREDMSRGAKAKSGQRAYKGRKAGSE